MFDSARESYYYAGFFILAFAFYAETFVFERTKLKFLIKTAIFFGYVMLGSYLGIVD